MTIADCKTGSIVETLHGGLPTGNVYRVENVCDNNRRYAWQSFRQGKVKLHVSVSCRLVEYPDTLAYQF